MKLLLVLALSLPAAQSFAEYRAYLLQVVDAKNKPIRTIASFLDDYQYTQYYHLDPQQFVYLADTWMCYGNTSNKPICPNPKAKPMDRLENPPEVKPAP